MWETLAVYFASSWASFLTHFSTNDFVIILFDVIVLGLIIGAFMLTFRRMDSLSQRHDAHRRDLTAFGSSIIDLQAAQTAQAQQFAELRSNHDAQLAELRSSQAEFRNIFFPGGYPQKKLT